MDPLPGVVSLLRSSRVSSRVLERHKGSLRLQDQLVRCSTLSDAAAIRVWDIRENRFVKSYTLPVALDEFTAFAVFKRKPFFMATYPDDNNRDAAHLWSIAFDSGPVASFSPYDVPAFHKLQRPKAANRGGGALAVCPSPMLFAMACGDFYVVLYQADTHKTTRVPSTLHKSEEYPTTLPFTFEATHVLDVSPLMLNLDGEHVSFLSFSPGAGRLLVGTSESEGSETKLPLAQLFVFDLTSSPPVYKGRLLNAPSVRRLRLTQECGSPQSEEGEVQKDDRVFNYTCVDLDSRKLSHSEMKACAYHFVPGSSERIWPCWANDAQHVYMGIGTGGFGIWDAKNTIIRRHYRGFPTARHINFFNNQSMALVASGCLVHVWELDSSLAERDAKRARLESDCGELAM